MKALTSFTAIHLAAWLKDLVHLVRGDCRWECLDPPYKSHWYMHNALSRAEPGCGVAATSCQAACSGTIQYGATAPMAALKTGTHGFDCLWDAVYHKLTTGAQ